VSLARVSARTLAMPTALQSPQHIQQSSDFSRGTFCVSKKDAFDP